MIDLNKKYYCNTNGSYYSVENYVSCKEVYLKSNYSSRVFSVRNQHLVNGDFKDPFKPTAYGIGYVGNISMQVKAHPFYKKGVTTWRNMLYRCYSEEGLEDNPTYTETFVTKEWHSLENFSKWFIENYDDTLENSNLDKDLLGDGSLYSPDTCCFLPTKLNNLLRHSHRDRGVSFRRRKSCWSSSINIEGNNRYLGSYENKQDAYNAYTIAWNSHVKETLRYYKNTLSTYIFKKLEETLIQF